MEIITDEQIKGVTSDKEIRKILTQINESKIPDEIKQVIYLNIQRIEKDEIGSILNSYLFEMENSEKKGFLTIIGLFKSKNEKVPELNILLGRLEKVFN